MPGRRDSPRLDFVNSRQPSSSLDASGLKLGILVGRFNESISSRLLAGAYEALVRHHARAEDIAVHWVPGAWELPLAAQALAQSGRFDALVALGCVVRGETTHHVHIGGEAAAGLARVSIETGVPIGFGVLTTDSVEQAVERSGGRAGNKGEEAALAAVELARLLTSIRNDLKRVAR